MRNLFLFVCLPVFAGFPLFSQAAFLTSFPRLPSKKKPVTFQLQTEFYYTRSNYREPETLWFISGKYADLSDKDELWYLRLDPSVSYSPYSWLILDVFLHSLWVNTVTGGHIRDRYQPTAAGGGFTLYKKLKSSYFGFEFKGGASMINITPNTDEVVAGDGAYFAEPGLWFIFRPRSQIFYLFYNTRFRYRTNGLSSLLFNAFGGVLKTDLADIGFSADIFFPIIKDDYSRQANQRWSITDRVNGGSYKFFSVDPRAVSFNIWTNWNFFKPSLLTLYLNIDTSGQNYSRGLTGGAIFAIQWQTGKGRSQRPRETLNALDLDYEEEYEEEEEESGKRKNKYFEEEDDPQSPFLKREMKNELRRLR